MEGNFERHGGLSDADYQAVLERLRTWASTHRRQSEQIIMIMGKPLTPHQFVHQIAEETEFGRSFLDYLRRQSEASVQTERPLRPQDFIDRAIQANR